MHDLLADLAVALIAATVFGLVAHRLRQPVLLGYLVAGALIGPALGVGLIRDRDSIDAIAEIGLVLLLFVVGMEMNLDELRRHGRRLLVTGFGQVLGCGLIGLAACAVVAAAGLLGGSALVWGYIATGCALSSTAIVVKLLHDRHEIDTRHGRIVIGVLVIQDLVAIVLLAFQPELAAPRAWPVARALLLSAALFAAAFVVSRYALSRVFQWIDRSPELVVATSIAWCAAVAGAAGRLGLSIEMGALVAGMSISAFPFSAHVSVRTTPLRDVFLTLFFIGLGMRIQAPQAALAWQVPALVLLVLVSRFATVYPLMAWQGGSRRTCFLASLDLAQISEFSLVLAAKGASPSYGHIDQGTVDLLVYATAASAVLSSYAIAGHHGLYRRFDILMTRWGWPDRETARSTFMRLNERDIVVLGFHRGARSLVEHLAQRRPELLPRMTVVDYNVETLEELKRLGVNPLFGDLASADSLAHALEGARMVVSTIPDVLLRGTSNLALTRGCRAICPDAVIIATAETPEHARTLEEAGATMVLLPYSLIGERVAELVEQSGVFGS